MELSIYFDQSSYWRVKFNKMDVDKFIREMGLLFPEGSTIYIEGKYIVPEVRRFLSSIQMKEMTKKYDRSIFSKPIRFHIPLTKDTLKAISECFNQWVLPEVCDHLMVYNNEKVLLEGYDIVGRIVKISTEIDENKVKELCSKLNCQYKKSG